MIRIFFLFLIFFEMGLHIQANPQSMQMPIYLTANLHFYSENLSLPYAPEMIVDVRVVAGEINQRTGKGSLQNFYEIFEKTNYHILLNELENYRQKWMLNDWLFYELLHRSVDAIYEGRPKLHRRLACWVMLSKAGFDARITYMNGEVFLNVFSKDEVFEVPMIEVEGKAFINLTSIHEKNEPADVLYIADFSPNFKGKPFSFNLYHLPNLKPEPNYREVHFEDQSVHYQFTIQFDQTAINLMKNYPFIAEFNYVKVPLSNTLSQSLLPILRDILAGKNQREALEILVAFTRSAFEYKTDEEVYGKSKPMIPDELFHYTFSDCEDRSALFFTLAKELLQVPMIVMAYHDHVTVGVATGERLGQPVIFKGTKYYVCDPTGPSNSVEIGQLPMGYEETGFEVLAVFNN